jgi:hypothetical protein
MIKRAKKMTQLFLINYSNAITFKTIVIIIHIVIVKQLRKKRKKCKMKLKLSQNSM